MCLVAFLFRDMLVCVGVCVCLFVCILLFVCFVLSSSRSVHHVVCVSECFILWCVPELFVYDNCVVFFLLL